MKWLEALGIVLLAGALGSCSKVGQTLGPGNDGAPDDAGLDGAADEETMCQEDLLELEHVVPDALVVLDRSTSMQELGHWDPVRAAVYAVTSELQHDVWFGLMVFPSVEEPRACSADEHQCAAGQSPIVPCGEEHSFAIRGALETMSPCGGTPTAATLDSARLYLRDLAASTGHPPYVILATDGAPNCNDSLDGTTCPCTAPVGCDPHVLNCLDDGRTYEVIDALRADGVGVFVIGIAASEWRGVLDGMAARGGTGAAALADDPASIRRAFEAATGAVVSCEFEVRDAPSASDPSLVNLYLDDEGVPADGDGTCAAGWTWVDSDRTRVRFCGPHCDRLRNDTVAEVRATFGCPTII